MVKTAVGSSLLLLLVLLHLTGSAQAYFGHNSQTVSITIPSANSRAGPLRVQLTAFNKTRVLLLVRKVHLLSSKFVLEYRSAGNRTVRTSSVNRNCYYSGTVDGESTSTVAVSTCHGLTGFVRTETEELLIRPRHGMSHSGSITQSTWLKHLVHRTFYRPRENRKVDGTDLSLDGNRHTGSDYSSQDVSSKSLPVLNQLREHTASTVFIETLLVADKSMLQRYGSTQLPVYVLSTMNEAANFFRSESLAVDVQLVVTHLVVLETDQKDIKIGKRPQQTLTNFCSWKNSSSADLPSHDVAVFLTRSGICFDRDGSCQTQGLAYTGGMCAPDQACTINHDDGLQLAYTVAHEIGHTLGMLHDEDAGCHYGRRRRKLMTSSLSMSPGAIGWSPCSERSLSAFIRSGRAACLYNMPIRTGTSDRLPRLSLETICMQVAGKSAQVCHPHTFDTDTVCSGVWCKRSGNHPCVLVQSSELDRVACGTKQICMNAKCVVGGWSRWTGYSLCSATCGQGLQHRERHCLRDTLGCAGRSRQDRLCHTQPCPLGSEDVRVSQCASFNNKPFKDGKYYNWIPHLTQDPSMDCQLTCKPDKGSFFALLAPSVPGGTACSSRQNGVCVGGKCQVVRCDDVIESTVSRDKCGVCAGDGKSCRIVSATFQRHSLAIGYHEVARLPVGSVGINVTENGVSNSYLVVRSGRSASHYFVNGGWSLSQPGVYPAAGTSIYYRRSQSSFETIWISGPLKEPLVLMVLSQNGNVAVTYRYQINKGTSTVRPLVVVNEHYKWRYTMWSNCSRLCAGGKQTRQIFCHDTNTEKDVEQRRCYRPPGSLELSRPCNVEPCPPEWRVGPWMPTECPVSCGPGGTRKRDVLCVIQTTPSITRSAKNRLCDRNSKPSGKETCNSHPCPLGMWLEGPWNPCSVSCGEGQQKRETVCIDRHSHSKLPFNGCDPSPQPIDTKPCTMPRCPNEFACTDNKDCKFKTNRLCKMPYYQRLCCHSCKSSSGSFSASRA